MTKEQNYCVYQHKTPDGKVYIGVTKNVKNRWVPSHYKGCSLEPYIDKYGWKNIKHEILYGNLTRDEALKLEDQLIVKARENGTLLNMRRSGHYQDTEEFREEDKVRRKACHETHKEEDKAYTKAYREAHPDEYKAYQKAYYEANKDKLNARRREKRKNNKK